MESRFLRFWWGLCLISDINLTDTRHELYLRFKMSTQENNRTTSVGKVLCTSQISKLADKSQISKLAGFFFDFFQRFISANYNRSLIKIC